MTASSLSRSWRSGCPHVPAGTPYGAAVRAAGRAQRRDRLLAVASLTLRQRYPLPVLGFVVATQLSLTLLGYAPTSAGCWPSSSRSTAWRHIGPGAERDRRARRAPVLRLLDVDDAGGDHPVGYAEQLVLFVGVWWLGRSLRLRRAYLDELEDRARAAGARPRRPTRGRRGPRSGRASPGSCTTSWPTT